MDNDSVLPALSGHRTFLRGPAGCGKTTAGIAHLLNLLSDGVSPDSILVMVPQRTLAAPYNEALQSAELPPGPRVTILTAGGLARRNIELFWPAISHTAHFAHPNQPPSFLTLETAQYYMAHLVRPLLEEGFFESVVIERNRLYSQVIDNLNKAALVGFKYTEIGDRLKGAWNGEVAQAHIYEDAQECALRFRQYCLSHNLLDFSLQVEVFQNYLWPSFLFQTVLKNSYRHLITDNLEEDTPFAHQLLRQWLPDLDSALLIFDQDAGYRRFLAADPDSAANLQESCDQVIAFDRSWVAPLPLLSFSQRIGQVLERPGAADLKLQPADMSYQDVLAFPDQPLHFYPQMLDWVVNQVQSLVTAGTPPGEIAILAPFLPDALRFSLSNRLDQAGIPFRSHRPSRSLRDEPATHCLLTLAALAHPNWGFLPSKFDLAYAFIQAIEGLDLVRAQLLVEIVYRGRKDNPHLTSFALIKTEMQSRITYTLGNRYEALRTWLLDYASQPEDELDFFFSRLFGELLSQPGFGFHTNLDAGRVAANLIESVQKFRWAVGPGLAEEGIPLGKEYSLMVQDGVIAAQYIQEYAQESNAVLIAPAYTFLMQNHPVDFQFWMDIGSQAWSERLFQPLTQPYVLNQQWPVGRIWTDVDEFETSRENLYRLVLGLTRRCRKKVFLALSELSEQGFESRNMLLKAIQRILTEATRRP
jgi:hypothetical protein